MFNEEIAIDRSSLDEECSSAPAFYDYWSTQESNLKADLENLEAELSFTIRSMSEEEIKAEYGLKGKVTEGAISSIIKSDVKYTDLKRRYGTAESQRRSWEKKMKMLDVLASLYGQGYFSKIEARPNTRALLVSSIKAKIKEQIRERRPRKPKRP